MILGTAGHIDHGKTTLVRALTGVDTDRLPEEKRRGITIELGFAPLELGRHRHDWRRRRSRSRGVRANDGRRRDGHRSRAPRHRRRRRRDAADARAPRDPRAARRAQTASSRSRRRISSTTIGSRWSKRTSRDATSRALPDAPIVATSVQSGRGIAELRAALADVGARDSAACDDDLFRLPIDRVFTIKGTGTVVTGTVWSGPRQSRRDRSRASWRAHGARPRHPGPRRATRRRDRPGAERRSRWRGSTSPTCRVDRRSSPTRIGVRPCRRALTCRSCPTSTPTFDRARGFAFTSGRRKSVCAS